MRTVLLMLCALLSGPPPVMQGCSSLAALMGNLTGAGMYRLHVSGSARAHACVVCMHLVWCIRVYFPVFYVFDASHIQYIAVLIVYFSAYPKMPVELLLESIV